jgi:RNA polymerase sigma-70 factor (ECF subfamily)
LQEAISTNLKHLFATLPLLAQNGPLNLAKNTKTGQNQLGLKYPAQPETMDTQAYSQPSFSEIHEQYHPRIYRHILRLVQDPQEAEDLTQETFLRVYRQLTTLRHPEAIGTWLYRIATNLCYDRFRQPSYQKQIEPLEADEENERLVEKYLEDLNGPKLDQVIDQIQMSSCIQRYLDRLAEDYRIAILLHDLSEVPCAQIARLLNCSLETVKIRLFRARQKLKGVLSAECNFSYNSNGVLTCDPKFPSRP